MSEAGLSQRNSATAPAADSEIYSISWVVSLDSSFKSYWCSKVVNFFLQTLQTGLGKDQLTNKDCVL